jgi:2-polyprenyl-6-methoxyphenol hydroxylase-like FAD-dependent oxidoreductase
MYDAIVIGARCAGSPTAMLLARKGYRVLLLDRGQFPSDTMSTHYIHQPGVAKLGRWGLLDKIVASNCPPLTQATFDFGAFALTGSPPPADGMAAAYCPRRTVLDEILVTAAVAAGAELRENFSVQDLLWNGRAVGGVRGRTRTGRSVTERARVVIGAEGLHSMVARTVQAPSYHVQPTLTCAYYSYWSGLAMDSVELYLRPGRAVIALPTNDGLTCVAVQWPRHEFHAFRANIEGNFLRTLEVATGLADRVRAGRREARFVGTADLPNFFRKPYGAGWALVGDAGYHKDPHLGQGITDAFRDAELVADAVDAALSGRRPWDVALAAYEEARNQAVLPMYELTCELARLQPPAPERQQLLAALCGNQEATNRFLGTVAGTVPIPEFFAPANVQRILQAA